MASVMDAIIVYKWMLQSTSISTSSDDPYFDCHYGIPFPQPVSSIRRFGLFKCAPLGEQSLFECVAFHDGARKAGNKNANENMRIDERSGRDGKIKAYVLLRLSPSFPNVVLWIPPMPVSTTARISRQAHEFFCSAHPKELKTLTPMRAPAIARNNSAGARRQSHRLNTHPRSCNSRPALAKVPMPTLTLTHLRTLLKAVLSKLTGLSVYIVLPKKETAMTCFLILDLRKILVFQACF